MTIDMNRRQFVAALAAMPFAARTAWAATVPVIDTHIHLFDRRRPQGVPWPREDDPVPGISALPPRYRALVEPFDVVGAIAVEASPWLEDNQWMLAQLETDPIMVGTVGFLDPGKPDFGRNLERFRKSELFLGIRRDRSDLSMADGLETADFVSDLKLLADAGLSLDSARQPPSVWLRLTDQVPSLRLIVPHLPSTPLPEGRAAVDAYLADLSELGQRPHVYMKLSAILRRINGTVSTDLDVYRDGLDRLWNIFGEDRVLFGSDWPNSLHAAPFAEVMRFSREYISSKGTVAEEKVLWRNSIAAYRWPHRDPAQPRA